MIAGRRAVAAVVGAVVAVTVGVVVLAGVATADASRQHAVDRARAGALAAASAAVPTVLSYDYRHLDADFAKAESLLTPRFRAEYAATTAKQVKPLARKNKATSTADIQAAAVVEAEPDRAVVLVFVNQLATNVNLTQPRLDRARINVTVVRSGGRWLIDRMAPF